MLFFFGFAGLYLVQEMFNNGVVYFMAYWAQQYEDHDVNDIDVPRFVAIYGMSRWFLRWCLSY